MGPIGCPEMSVRNYHCTLSNIAEERRPHLHRGGNLKFFVVKVEREIENTVYFCILRELIDVIFGLRFL
jgi:hypothetical protein